MEYTYKLAGVWEAAEATGFTNHALESRLAIAERLEHIAALIDEYGKQLKTLTNTIEISLRK